MRSVLLVAVLAALSVTACGGASAGPPVASAWPTPSAHVVLVTRADDRGTVRARVGDRVQIALGSEFEWHLDAADGVVLVPGVQNALLVRGTQALWTAAAAGTSTITVTGTVICPSGQACIQLALSFKATVVVEP